RRAYLFRDKAQALSYVASKWRSVGNLVEALTNLRAAMESTKQALREDPLNVEVVSFLKSIIGDERNPNWKQYCDDQLPKGEVKPAHKQQLQSIVSFLTTTASKHTPDLPADGSLNWSILPLIPGEWVTLGSQEKAAEIRYLTNSEIHPSINPA